MTKREKSTILIFKLLLAFMSVEYLNFSGLSIYKLIVFPLSLVGCFLVIKADDGKYYTPLIFTLSLFLVWYSISSMIAGDNWLTGFFLLPLCFFTIKFLFCFNSFQQEFAPILATYSVPHIICYLIGFQMNPGSGRFSGLCMDANFCGLYLSIALVASVYLLTLNTKKIIKFLLLIHILFTIYLIFCTGSRGSILSILIIASLCFLFSKRSLLLKCVIAVLALAGYSYLTQYINGLPFYVSPDVSLVDSVLCRFQRGNIEEGSGRREIWSYALQAMFNGDYYFLPIGRETVMSGFTNGFLHNSYLELMVRTGIVTGLIMAVSVTCAVIKLMISYYRKQIPNHLLSLTFVCFVVMLELFFISAVDFKMFWICLFIIFSINLICKYHIS